MTLVPDRQLLYPYVCEISTPYGVVALHNRTTGPAHIEVTEILRSELDGLSKSLGVLIKDPGKCSSEGSESTAPDGVVGYRFTLSSPQELSIEYSRARPLRMLSRLDRVTLRENLTDRYADTLWTNAVVEERPSLPIKAGGKALENEFCWLQSLKLIWLKPTL